MKGAFYLKAEINISQVRYLRNKQLDRKVRVMLAQKLWDRLSIWPVMM